MSKPALPRFRVSVFLAFVLLLGGCEKQDLVSRGRIAAFDSTMEITLIGVDRARAAAITESLASDLDTMAAAWDASGSGPLARVNALFNEGSPPFAAPPSLLPLMNLSKQLAEQSDDLFNPAIGHLMRAWGFQSDQAECRQPPSPDILEQALKAAPSMREITIDGIRVASANPMVKLDFHAIRDGYAVDQVIARLQEQGVQNASVAIDGNIRTLGSRDGHPWSVTVRGATGGGVLATVQLRDSEAVFTVGAYQNEFTWEGQHFHDVIDPRTGYPATGATSVTVLHRNASTADAAATALFVAGPDDWHRVARKMGVRYVMLTDDAGRVHMNPAMQSRVKLHGGNREVVISEPLT